MVPSTTPPTPAAPRASPPLTPRLSPDSPRPGHRSDPAPPPGPYRVYETFAPPVRPPRWACPHPNLCPRATIKWTPGRSSGRPLRNFATAALISQAVKKRNRLATGCRCARGSGPAVSPSEPIGRRTARDRGHLRRSSTRSHRHGVECAATAECLVEGAPCRRIDSGAFHGLARLRPASGPVQLTCNSAHHRSRRCRCRGDGGARVDGCLHAAPRPQRALSRSRLLPDWRRTTSRR